MYKMVGEIEHDKDLGQNVDGQERDNMTSTTPCLLFFKSSQNLQKGIGNTY